MTAGDEGDIGRNPASAGPHRSHAYRERCSGQRRVVRTERRTVHNPLYDPFWPDEDEEAELDIDVAVPVLDEHGNQQYEACEAPAAGACMRCRRPFCADHDPGPFRRCESCERAYDERPDSAIPLIIGLAGVAGIAAGLVWLLVAGTEMRGGLLTCFGGCALMGLGAALARMLSARRRRIFLAEAPAAR